MLFKPEWPWDLHLDEHQILGCDELRSFEIPPQLSSKNEDPQSTQVIQEYLLSFPEKWMSLLRDEWLSGSSAAATIWLTQGVCVPAPLPLTESGVEAF